MRTNVQSQAKKVSRQVESEDDNEEMSAPARTIPTKPSHPKKSNLSRDLPARSPSPIQPLPPIVDTKKLIAKKRKAVDAPAPVSNKKARKTANPTKPASKSSAAVPPIPETQITAADPADKVLEPVKKAKAQGPAKAKSKPQTKSGLKVSTSLLSVVYN
ncbi:hypothetical protein CTheo_9216 [Ceratobasidium theobromae]|uniref:Uncharacterized protein n=1 Tax=Ceratobasidium theobromae TaxID=1582974 RepID=A0A5N5Q654_9AGAM|nr:hypothetical protein CTheo_9216 [Ceratobasidium theobromae]